MDFITELLLEKKDEKYASFQRRLVPNIAPDTVIGVRTPDLRQIAKALRGDERAEEFLKALPHSYFEENQLHGFILSDMKDFGRCIEETEKFLPYIDNWATCDQTSPKVFAKHKEELLPHIRKWFESGHPYTIRFAIGMLMRHFLDGDFRKEYIGLVASVRSDEYYVNMEIAWYMATALAKQWDSALPYIEGRKLDCWVHNKTIQKARESYRITAEQKEYLATFKEKG